MGFDRLDGEWGGVSCLVSERERPRGMTRVKRRNWSRV